MYTHYKNTYTPEENKVEKGNNLNRISVSPTRISSLHNSLLLKKNRQHLLITVAANIPLVVGLCFYATDV